MICLAFLREDPGKNRLTLGWPRLFCCCTGASVSSVIGIPVIEMGRTLLSYVWHHVLIRKYAGM